MNPSDAQSLWSALERLLLAAALGAAVGLERETKRKPAGLRTIILLTFGSALFTQLSETLARLYGGDPTRIAAQLIPGIGFLGAGAIIQARGGVIGLTTAATIFAMAAVGMACGGGQFLLAGAATVVLLLILVLIGWIEQRTERKLRLLSFSLLTRKAERCVAELVELGRTQRVTLRDLRIVQTEEHSRVEFVVEAFEGSEAQIVRQLEEIRQAHG